MKTVSIQKLVWIIFICCCCYFIAQITVDVNIHLETFILKKSACCGSLDLKLITSFSLDTMQQSHDIQFMLLELNDYQFVILKTHKNCLSSSISAKQISRYLKRKVGKRPHIKTSKTSHPFSKTTFLWKELWLFCGKKNVEKKRIANIVISGHSPYLL